MKITTIMRSMHWEWGLKARCSKSIVATDPGECNMEGWTRDR